MGLVTRLRNALRRWLLTAGEQDAFSPDRVDLTDGTTIIAAGAVGLHLVVANRTHGDATSGGRRLVSVWHAADPAQFWCVWQRFSGDGLALPDGTPIDLADYFGKNPEI